MSRPRLFMVSAIADSASPVLVVGPVATCPLGVPAATCVDVFAPLDAAVLEGPAATGPAGPPCPLISGALAAACPFEAALSGVVPAGAVLSGAVPAGAVP
ncbi:hypothetical protein, partial [Streptosporangium album]|uniref:hypothetical protein n=1 Tax=Streptosporangium album TaxID=47479 RepID=UPI0031ED312A